MEIFRENKEPKNAEELTFFVKCLEKGPKNPNR